MISRRRFLEVGTIAVGVAAVSHPALACGAGPTSAEDQMSQAGTPSNPENRGQNPEPAIPQILIVSPEEARVYSQGMGEARILVGGERSGGAWWMGQFREDPGFMTLLHLHPHMDEYFFVLQGVLSATSERERLPWCPAARHMLRATQEKNRFISPGQAVRQASSGFLSNWMRSPNGYLPARSSEPKSPRLCRSTTPSRWARRPAGPSSSRKNSRMRGSPITGAEAALIARSHALTFVLVRFHFPAACSRTIQFSRTYLM